MTVAQIGPSGLVVFIGNANPDLTVGAITWRPFGPRGFDW